ncbi:unnamed protein product, partial [Medioppia subpectinata]
YRTDEGKPYLLPVVQKVEKSLAIADDLHHEYVPQLGDEAFTRSATRLLLGGDSPAIAEKRTLGIQSLSGTGALKIGADLLREAVGFNTIYLPVPSYANHELLFSRAGFQVLTYRYYDNVRHLLDMNGMITDIRQAAPGSVILFHTCAHNPTGMDPTRDQWSQIADIMVERRLFPFFDCAYQGFASGDPDRDAYSVRLFVDRGLELVCAQSFSKNFGLYGERVGNLTIVLNNPKPIENICSQMLMIVRGNYSGPPSHGASIVTKILNDPQLYEEKCCVQIMATRMREMRSQLREHLERLGTPGEWSHITRQIGMFSYTGLTDRQVTHLLDSYHIYMLSNGRLSMCGLTTKNIEYVAKAIRDAVIKFPCHKKNK